MSVLFHPENNTSSRFSLALLSIFSSACSTRVILNRPSFVLSVMILLFSLLNSLPIAAEVLNKEDLKVGDTIVIQDKKTGQWCSPAFNDAWLALGLCGYQPGITESSVFYVDVTSGNEQVLTDTLEQRYPMTLLNNAIAFRYDFKSQIPKSNYAINVEQQVTDIVGSVDGVNLVSPVYDRWDVEPNYGVWYGFPFHTQGIAITSDGIWVQTQSAGWPACLGVLQSINPITERDVHHLTWDPEDDVTCDAHTTGIQAVGNHVAVHSFNNGGIPDVKFFHVSRSGMLTRKPYLRLKLDDGEQYIQVGIVYVEEVGYFLYPKYTGGGKLFFRATLEDDGSQWNELYDGFSGSWRTPQLNDGGNKMVMESGTGNLYFFNLGSPGGNDLDDRNKFQLYVIKPDLVNYSSVKDYWSAVAAGNKKPSLSKVDDYILPGAGSTHLDHRFYNGGDAFVNEAGRLDILQAPRDFVDKFQNTVTFDQADYVVIRSKTGTPVNKITRGKVTRFKALEETSDGAGDDEVYFITNFKKGAVFENISEGTVVTYDLICDLIDCSSIGFEPQPLMDVVSSSDKGTYVHLMEEDAGAVFGERPDKIGEIFIPPQQYARQGLHEYTTILYGDGGRYEVTYEVINEASTELVIDCEAPDGIWYPDDVQILCNWSYPPDSNGSFYLSTDVTANTETDNAETVSYELCPLDLPCVTVGSKGHNRVDKKAPVITIESPAARQYTHSETLTLNYSVTDGGSGVSTVTPTMNGDTVVAGSELHNGQAINLLQSLPLGNHTFTTNADDKVGNVSSPVSVTFSIIVTPLSIIETLNQLVENGEIKHNAVNPLMAKLRNAKLKWEQDQCTPAKNMYGAFINHLQAQSSKNVSSFAADILITDAEYLIAHCGDLEPEPIETVLTDTNDTNDINDTGESMPVNNEQHQYSNTLSVQEVDDDEADESTSSGSISGWSSIIMLFLMLVGRRIKIKTL